jgi:hypothetical protein
VNAKYRKDLDHGGIAADCGLLATLEELAHDLASC